jgi:UDP-N-acetylglucosamine--N-acetylmuramyl-(pentapeptide) pyrophosphoryl-undecaprenol N-acetylglucosamine transferase
MITGEFHHIVFAGGGTGGHLFPGLAVAARLMAAAPQMRITFAGSGMEFEREQVRAAGFQYVAIPCRALPRRLRHVLPFLAANIAGHWRAKRFLQRNRIAAVVALGGYACFPMAHAAARLRIPLMLLEQNAVPGRATRWLAPSATLVCTAFEQAARQLPLGCTVRVTGNPVRPGFSPRMVAAPGSGHGDGPMGGERTLAAAGRRPKHLLVLGGTTGAQSLNEHVPRALYRVGPDLAGWKIVHQSGPAQLEATRELYRRLGLSAAVVPYIVDMPPMLSQTDLAICRAGGTTLAELAVAGVPAILVPYPDAAGDHQRKNAEPFAAAGACILLDEHDRFARLEDLLAATLPPLLTDPRRRAAMSQAISRLAQPEAAWEIASAIQELVQ